MTKFLVPTEKEILEGESTDQYFIETMNALEGSGINPYVTMEAYLKKFPDPNYKFGVLCGVCEVAKLLEGKHVDVYAMEEGEFFFPGEPVLQIKGKYRDFGIFENSILGFLCKPSAIATRATRCRMVAEEKSLISFGTRRVWPFDVEMVEYATTVGGFDGVSNIAGAKKIGKKATGTMPHALMLASKGSKKGFEAFKNYSSKDAPNIALIDTYGSPKSELFDALEVFGDDLYGVRIDSGDLKKVGKEIRWELDIRGRKDVKLICSGGLDEYKIKELKDVYDGFGVGTKIADSPTFDFSLKIVEVDGEPRAKFGNFSGAKQVYRKDFHHKDIVTLSKNPKPMGYNGLLKPLIKDGEIVRDFEDVEIIRKRTLKKISDLPPELKEIDTPYIDRVEFMG
ncbi:MAG: nicotinate phosphoribosyltransferase [Candidatus Aenigmarchaeota archaeon]|nr:nicotinate phosphoribosyltransferase [Candidatus Aenigmarchaeota archaeon]